jgi:hypothetical protein
MQFDSTDEEQEPTAYLRECITALTNYLVEEVPGMNLVVFRIRNSNNVGNKVVGFTLWRRYQFKPDVVWDVLGKNIQSNARFDVTERLKVHLDNVRMLAGIAKMAEKTKGGL